MVGSASILGTILKIFQGLLTPVIAIIAVYIAYQQHKTNRDKLGFDLYNKRYEVFRSLKTLLARISQQGNVKDEQVNEFLRATKEAVFLFDEGISTYLEIIGQKAFDLQAIEECMKPLPVGEERNSKVAESRELRDWFSEQSKVAIVKFNKYLKFEQKLYADANWKRGFRRLTWILSIIVALATGAFPVWVYIHDQVIREKPILPLEFTLAYTSGAAIGWICVWVIYFVTSGVIVPLTCWIINGFCKDEPKDNKNNK